MVMKKNISQNKLKKKQEKEKETSKISFNEKKHEYKKGKTKYTSVTTFIKQFFSEFDAKKIARKLAKFPINKTNKRGVRYWLSKWKEDAYRGTRIHNIIQSLIRDPELRETVDARDYELISNTLIWFNENYKKEKNIKTEVLVFNDESKICGMADVIIYHDNKEVTILDWKTNKEIKKESYDKKTFAKEPISNLQDCNYSIYSLQLSLYAYLLEKQGYKIRDLKLVHLIDNKVIPYNIRYDKKNIEEMIKYDKETKGN